MNIRAPDRDRPLDAIVIGRAGMDLYPEPVGCSIEEAQRFKADLGGAGGNIAVALARQGGRSALATSFSDDAVGRFVLAGLARYGVDTSECRVVQGESRTSLALAETRITDCEVVIYRNGAADLEAGGPSLPPKFLERSEILIVTGTSLARESSRSLAMAAIEAARNAGTFVMLDIDHRPYSWPSPACAAEAYSAAARLCDAVIGNVEEFAILSGSESAASAVAGTLVAAGASFAIVKNGEKGSTTFSRDGVFETKPFRVTAKKPFGAGDAFLGGLVAAWRRGAMLPDAVRWGSAAAAIAVSRQGCASAMPTAEDVGVFMSGRPVQ